MQFRVLGPLEVRDGERPLRLGGPKQRALLGVLLLQANRRVGVDRLVDELWGAAPPATAEKLVKGYVHALRKELGSAIATESGGYLLCVDARQVDHLEFERLVADARRRRPPEAARLREQALSLWRGDPLADLELHGDSRHVLTRLSELRFATTLDAMDWELESGRHADVVADLESLVVANPYNERLHAQLILALYRGGRQADALAVYQSLRRRLADELGLTPSEALRQIEGAILRQEPAVDPPRRRERHRPSRIVPVAAIAGGLVLGALVVATKSSDDAMVLAARSIGKVEPSTNRLVAEVPIGTSPAFVLGRGRTVWAVGDDAMVVRVDAEKNRVRSAIPAGGSASSAARGPDKLWVGDEDANAIRVLSTTHDALLETIALSAPSRRAAILGSVAPGLAFCDGVLWVSHGQDTVRRIDPVSGETLGVIRPPRGANPAIACGSGALWVGGPNAVTRISLDSEIVTSVRLPGTPVALSVGGDAVWAALGANGKLARIDTATEAVETIDLNGAVTAVAAAGRDVWAVVPSRAALMRITSGRVVATIRTGATPTSVGIIDNEVWVGVR